MAARVGSPASAMSAAAPAVSATTRIRRPCRRRKSRHWPSAWTWLSTSWIACQRGAGHAQQLVVHPHELLADDVQPAARQQVMHVGHPPGDRVVDRRSWRSAPARRARPRRRPRTSGRAGRAARETPAGRPCASRRRAGPGTRRCAPVGRRAGRRVAGAPGCAAPSRGRPACRRRTAPRRPAARRCSCRAPAPAAAPAARAAPAGSAAGRRSARAPRA